MAKIDDAPMELVEIMMPKIVFDSFKPIFESRYPLLTIVKFPDTLNSEGVSASYMITTKEK